MKDEIRDKIYSILNELKWNFKDGHGVDGFYTINANPVPHIMWFITIGDNYIRINSFKINTNSYQTTMNTVLTYIEQSVFDYKFFKSIFINYKMFIK